MLGRVAAASTRRISPQPQPRMPTMILDQLAQYQPLFIEGMGYYDPRDPNVVAGQIVKQLQSRFSDESSNKTKPKLLITQGDPLSERGISAITPLVGEMLGIPRGLVVLDDHIDPWHSQNAPRDTNVVLEMKYSDMLRVLSNTSSSDGGESTGSNKSSDDSIAARLEQKVDGYIAAKNQRRREMDKPPLKSYFKDYVMLQEVTKAACRSICGDIVVAHTAQDISEFSVTSFYEVGLDLGLLDDTHYVPYGAVDELDFDKIDTR